jgi:hypothetical protein
MFSSVVEAPAWVLWRPGLSAVGLYSTAVKEKTA